MKKIFLLFTTCYCINFVAAQDASCYSKTIKNISLCGSAYKWRSVKIIAPRQKLLNFIATSKVMHDCSTAFKNQEDIAKEFKPENCTSDKVRIEIEDPKDVIQLYKDAINQDPEGSVQVCLSSDGTISITLGVGDASVEVNSKGKFSFSAKGQDGIERKVEL